MKISFIISTLLVGMASTASALPTDTRHADFSDAILYKRSPPDTTKPIGQPCNPHNKELCIRYLTKSKQDVKHHIKRLENFRRRIYKIAFDPKRTQVSGIGGTPLWNLINSPLAGHLNQFSLAFERLKELLESIPEDYDDAVHQAGWKFLFLDPMVTFQKEAFKQADTIRKSVSAALTELDEEKKAGKQQPGFDEELEIFAINRNPKHKQWTNFISHIIMIFDISLNIMRNN